MTQPAVANPTRSSLTRRVIHGAVVALCTASTLALLGAERASDARPAAARKPVAAASVPVAKAMPLTPAVVAASVLPRVESVELLVDDDDAPAEPARMVATPAILPTIPAAPRSRIVRMEVTAYCPCTKCCGPNAQGITASGKLVSYNDGKFVAADTGVLPFGTRLVVPGYADGQPVEVTDRGGAIKGNKLDLYFNSHTDALIWGRQHLDVEVLE